MSAEIVIRRESPDQPEVAALLGALDGYLASLYPPEANHILDVQALLAPDVGFFVAREGGQLVGTGAVRRMAGEPASGGVSYGEVKRMMVDPARRGRGIGARLLQALEDSLRAEGITLALLETGRDQAEAVRLYERCGYSRRTAFGGYPDNGLSVFYGKRL
ncbi:MAG: GNAT family N-acetyltransferase [Rubrivivax sp.]|nr:GNAT family N-acetyltransferase [Rubrivivax sp.]